MQIQAEFWERIPHDERDFDGTARDWRLRWGHQLAGGVLTDPAALRLRWELVDDGPGFRLCQVWSAHEWY